MGLYVDGRDYDVHITELKRSADVLDGPNSGRSTSGRMTRDVIGTFYNYSVEIDSDLLSMSEYDDLYEVLSAPVESHIVRFPWGQTTLQFEAYVSKVEDSLIDASNGKQRWGNMSFQFIATGPQR